MIRLARAEDIPRLQELLGQILLVHHYARPDVFKSEGSKFTDADLEAVINDSNKPIFVYEDEEGRILGHLFLMIKEVSDNNSPLFLLMIYALIRRLEVKNWERSFINLPWTMLRS